MKQLTVRGLDDDLAMKVQEVARERGISLNKAALLLLREGAGLASETGSNRIGASLDHLVGAWSPEEAAAFLATLEAFDTIDESLWS